MRKSARLALFLLSVFLVTGIFLAKSSVVRAQSAADNDVVGLRSQYRVQLTVYQTDQRTFEQARDQYAQLQTLTALEEAVKATQKVLLSRDDVLLTYLKIVRYTFSQTDGLQLDVKKSKIEKLDKIISDISTNKDAAAKATTREQVAQVSAEFSTLYQSAQTAANEATQMMNYGRVQALFDKTVAVRDEIKSHVLQNEPDALKLSEKQRAFSLIDQTVEETRQQLQSVAATFAPVGTSNFTGLGGGDVNTAYAGISRTISYLQEVIRK